MTTEPTPTIYGGRIVNGNAQAAVQEHRHPDGRSIRLVGLAHLAEPEYFAEIRRITEDAEASGATVRFEGVRAAVEFRDVSDEERSAMIAMDQALGTQNKDILELFELPWINQDQSVLAPYFKKWEPADSNSLDMIRLLGPKNVEMVAPSAAVFEHYKRLKETQDEDPEAFMVARSNWVTAFTELYRQPSTTMHVDQRAFQPAPTGNGWMVPYIYTYRECVAALRTLEINGDVVLLWHPGHMIHLGRIFARNGFAPCETVEWLTVFHKVEHNPAKQKRPATQEADA